MEPNIDNTQLPKLESVTIMIVVDEQGIHLRPQDRDCMVREYVLEAHERIITMLRRELPAIMKSMDGEEPIWNRPSTN